MQAGRRGTETVLLSAVAATVAAVLGLIALGRRSLWMDEALDIAFSGLDWNDLSVLPSIKKGVRPSISCS